MLLLRLKAGRNDVFAAVVMLHLRCRETQRTAGTRGIVLLSLAEPGADSMTAKLIDLSGPSGTGVAPLIIREKPVNMNWFLQK
jgi:hypothetical protein